MSAEHGRFGIDTGCDPASMRVIANLQWPQGSRPPGPWASANGSDPREVYNACTRMVRGLLR
jgi:hypothetical protein